MKPAEYILNDPKLRAQFAALQNAADVHDEFILSHRTELEPKAALPDLRRKIEHADPKTAVELAKKLEALCSPAAEQVAVAHRREVGRLYETFRKQAIEFLESSLVALENLRTEAVAKEKTFFGEFGLPRTETAASRNVAESIASCKNFLEGLRKPKLSGLSRAANCGLFGWLRIG